MGAIGLLLVVGGALTCRPPWYQPLSIDYSRLEDDKRAQLRLENRISAALNRGSPIEIELDEAQVNRWIAARHELWPGEVPSLEPFRRPQLVFLDRNRIRLGALVEHSALKVVLSVTFRIDLQPDNLVVTLEAVHAGTLPAPRRVIRPAAAKLADRSGLPEEAIAEGRIALPNEGTWPNGKRRFRVSDLSIRKGTIRVRLEPF